MADVRAVGGSGGGGGVSIIVTCVVHPVVHAHTFIQLSMLIPSTYAPFISSFVVSPFFGIVTVRSTWCMRRFGYMVVVDSSNGVGFTDDAEAHG